MNFSLFVLLLIFPILSLFSAELPPNGDFEERAGDFLAYWSRGAIRGELGKDVFVELSTQTLQGNYCVELRTTSQAKAVLNSDSLSILKGRLVFNYKAISSAGSDNLAVFVIPLDKNGRETSPGRAKYIIPKSHIGDGKWHKATIDFDYLDFLNVEKVLIGARINESGVDGAGHFLIDCVSLIPASYQIAPKISLYIAPARPIYLVGEKPKFSIRVRNEGRRDSKEGILFLTIGKATQQISLPGLKVGEEKNIAVELPLLKETGLLKGSAILRAGEIQSSKQFSLIALKDLPKTGLSLELFNSRILFPKTPFGYGMAIIQHKNGKNWEDVAIIPSLFTLKTESSSVEAFTNNFSRYKSAIVFRGKLSAGAEWNYEVRYRAELSAQQFVLSIKCTPSKDAPISALFFPRIYAGERSLGKGKRYALFPGLEFLQGDERSSSTRDVNPPDSDRWAPHPYKITIPLQSISFPTCTISLLWDANQKWNGSDVFPSALFASPNFLEGGDNHLLSLFLPSIPKYVRENSLGAKPAYVAKAGIPLTLTCRISITDGDDVISSINEWKKAFGFPKPKLPRSIEEEMELCATCYTDVIWDEKAFGWLPWTGVPHQLDVNVSFALLKMANHIKNRVVKEKALSLAERTLKVATPKNSLEVAFRLGELEEALKRTESSAKETMKSQREDGSWVFQPDEKRKSLGKEGETEIGICAPPAGSILRWALISGDEEAKEKGLKALKFMDRFYIPAGAQTWECPLHAPDIYASAVAIPPYIYGYELTKDKHYLERAKEMALAGIPFIYLWKSAERSRVMLGASIPIFGATFHVLPWFARPVQWNGLAYAHSLRLLAKYDDSFPWKDIADLILQSAMEQQATEGEYKGLYPDSFGLIPNEPYGPWLAPILILRNLFYLTGHPLDISFKVLHTKKGNFHISSGVYFTAKFSEGKLTIETEPGDLPNAFLTIAGINKPIEVRVNGEKISQATTIDEAEQGWNYIERWRMLVLKIRCGGKNLIGIKTE
ncbi:hypothetical protein H5T88_07980 [bacterium]|nr:hypothetical protein [bacterium]